MSRIWNRPIWEKILDLIKVQKLALILLKDRTETYRLNLFRSDPATTLIILVINLQLSNQERNHELRMKKKRWEIWTTNLQRSDSRTNWQEILKSQIFITQIQIPEKITLSCDSETGGKTKSNIKAGIICNKSMQTEKWSHLATSTRIQRLAPGMARRKLQRMGIYWSPSAQKIAIREEGMLQAIDLRVVVELYWRVLEIIIFSVWTN